MAFTSSTGRVVTAVRRVVGVSVRSWWLLALLVLPMLARSRGHAKPPLVPPELTQACVKRTVGAPCTASMQGHTMQGTCTQLPDHTLACRPGGRGKVVPKPPPVERHPRE